MKFLALFLTITVIYVSCGAPDSDTKLFNENSAPEVTEAKLITDACRDFITENALDNPSEETLVTTEEKMQEAKFASQTLCEWASEEKDPTVQKRIVIASAVIAGFVAYGVARAPIHGKHTKYVDKIRQWLKDSKGTYNFYIPKNGWAKSNFAKLRQKVGAFFTFGQPVAETPKGLRGVVHTNHMINDWARDFDHLGDYGKISRKYKTINSELSPRNFTDKVDFAMKFQAPPYVVGNRIIRNEFAPKTFVLSDRDSVALMYQGNNLSSYLKKSFFKTQMESS